jgi:hypothetical protein
MIISAVIEQEKPSKILLRPMRVEKDVVGIQPARSYARSVLGPYTGRPTETDLLSYCDAAEVPHYPAYSFEEILAVFGDAGVASDKFIPVLFSDASPEQIPMPIRGGTRYVVDTKDGYEELYRRLTGQPRLLRPALGAIRSLPARRRLWSEAQAEAATAPASSSASRSWHLPWAHSKRTRRLSSRQCAG